MQHARGEMSACGGPACWARPQATPVGGAATPVLEATWLQRGEAGLRSKRAVASRRAGTTPMLAAWSLRFLGFGRQPTGGYGSSR